MKLTVKKYKHLNVGHEGGAMSCELYADGVLRARVENQGYGGPNSYEWLNSPSRWDVPADIAAHVAAQPLDYTYGEDGLQLDIDCLVGDAIFDFEVAKKIAARCKKVIVFSLPTDEKGVVREYKTPYTPAAAALVRRQYPTARIHNEAL